MAFWTYKELEDVIRPHQIRMRQERFVEPVPFPVDDRFRQRLEFHLQNAPVSASEAAVCEFLIAPVLHEIWCAYSDSLMIWSHVSHLLEDEMMGFPDWFFARRVPLGPVRDKPYVLFIIEAKRDDFEGGWGQCLEAMVAAQKLNAESERMILGGVSDGRIWYFGKLMGSELTLDPREFTVNDLAELFAALNWVFRQARDEVLAAAA